MSTTGVVSRADTAQPSGAPEFTPGFSGGGQKFQDTKGVIRRHKSMKDREHNGQMFEDTKGVIKRHKSMKDRVHNGQKFEDTKGLIRRHKSKKR